jgi:hypothetical protein
MIVTAEPKGVAPELHIGNHVVRSRDISCPNQLGVGPHEGWSMMGGHLEISWVPKEASHLFGCMGLRVCHAFHDLQLHNDSL